MKSRISGVILSGGANKRFGGLTKANIVIGGETIISGILSKISDLFDEKIIVTNRPDEFRYLVQCRIIEDEYMKVGPLGGIHAALKATAKDAIFVFAGDMPFLDKEIINTQIDAFNGTEYDVMIPRIGQIIEPLHAIYRKSVLKDLEMFIEDGKGRAVRDFLEKINVGFLEIPETEKNRMAFTNINSPADITKLNL
ncbi:MAG: molybdenum cofactor guanylyltransferase [Bacteroidales bacterium]